MVVDMTAGEAVPTKPIVMDASSTATAKAVGGTVLASVLLVATALPTIASLIKAHSLVKDILWIQSQDGVGFISAVGFLATSAWVVIKRLKLRERSLTAGRSASDRDVIVKNDVPTILPSGTVSYPTPPVETPAPSATGTVSPPMGFHHNADGLRDYVDQHLYRPSDTNPLGFGTELMIAKSDHVWFKNCTIDGVKIGWHEPPKAGG